MQRTQRNNIRLLADAQVSLRVRFNSIVKSMKPSDETMRLSDQGANGCQSTPPLPKVRVNRHTFRIASVSLPGDSAEPTTSEQQNSQEAGHVLG